MHIFHIFGKFGCWRIKRICRAKYRCRCSLGEVYTKEERKNSPLQFGSGELLVRVCLFGYRSFDCTAIDQRLTDHLIVRRSIRGRSID